MATFAELITEYTLRIGISDAELARKIGVRRQTIFRWKEGLVQRPRDRQVVLDIGKALRLTPEEQDGLLLSAGFAPESIPELPDKETLPEEVVGNEIDSTSSPELAHEPPQVSDNAHTDTPPSGDTTSEENKENPQEAEPVDESVIVSEPVLKSAERPAFNRMLLPGIALLLLAGLAYWFGFRAAPIADAPQPTPSAESNTASAAPTATVAPTAVVQADPWDVCTPESDEEVLILVARFVPYGTRRYNVAGRIIEALEEETSSEAQAATQVIESLRVALFDEQISSKQEGEELISMCPAAVLVWGEYDDGRVLAQTTSIKDDRIQFPADRITEFNVDIPAGVRILALEALGAMLRTENRYADAASSFELALTPLPDAPEVPSDEQRYNLTFYLGHALYVQGTQTATTKNLDEAIDTYSDAIELSEQLKKRDPALLYNRGIAYMARYQADPNNDADKLNLSLAISDLDAALKLRRDYDPAYIMRSNAYTLRGDDGDIEAAIRDYSAVIALAENPNGRHYFNRGLAHIRANNVSSWESDLDKALEFGHSARQVYTAKCYARLRQVQAEEAKAECEAALAEAPQAADNTYVNYAIALAVLDEEEEAIRYLQEHIEWLNDVPGRYKRSQGALADEWLTQLQAGEQPFDAETLRNLE